MNINIELKDVKQVKEVIVSSIHLIEQIEINDYKDGFNNDIKMNKSYHELKEAISNLQPIE